MLSLSLAVSLSWLPDVIKVSEVRKLTPHPPATPPSDPADEVGGARGGAGGGGRAKTIEKQRMCLGMWGGLTFFYILLLQLNSQQFPVAEPPNTLLRVCQLIYEISWRRQQKRQGKKGTSPPTPNPNHSRTQTGLGNGWVEWK